MRRYIVIGAGAVGAVLAARLYGIGREVVLVGRPGAHVAAIRTHGLRVVGQRRTRRNDARFFGAVPRQASAAWAGIMVVG